MNAFNIYLIGVGGQGIGLISEVVLRAADHAGLAVKGVDTHGLAQRGGIVVSQVRIGKDARSPLIPRGQADLVIALERHEALRGMNSILKDNGILVYYNTVQQTLETRLNEAEEVSEALISENCSARGIKEVKVTAEALPDPRMQNMALLSAISRDQLIPEITTEHYKEAISDLLQGEVLEKNLEVLEKGINIC